jgi:hypothetical protein
VIVSTVPAQKLGLPIVSVDGCLRLLPDKKICHGFATGCRCEECMDRASSPVVAPERVRQPWELAA